MAPKVLHKNCLHCNSRFNTYEPHKDFCNDVCKCRATLIKNASPQKDPTKADLKTVRDKNKRRTRWGEGIYKTCRRCGEIFKAESPVLYCSGGCRYAYEFENNTEEKRAVCVECGLEFIGSTRGRVFCSKACSNGNNNTKAKERRIKKKLEGGLEWKDRPKNGKPLHLLNWLAEKKRLEAEWKNLVKFGKKPQ